MKSENETFILSIEKENDEIYYLNKLKVTAGRPNNRFVELMEIPISKKILIKGVYNIVIE